MSTIELASKVRKLKELKVLAEELAAEITSIEDTIKAEMTARDVTEMTVDVYRVRWPFISTSRFDSSAFRATHADLYSQYCKESVSRRFSIT